MKQLRLAKKLATKSTASLLLLAGAAPAFAQVSMLDYAQNPPLSEEVNSSPMIMLTLSSDHQVFIKAYNDYDDLDGDGVVDVTYKPSIEYIGYFDQKKCYEYTGSGENAYYKITGDADAQHYCSNAWSGNFLNWASMTRIDIVRSVLYGGYRSIDDADRTVLERSYLPHDAHSFAKYYAGDDIDRLVPADAIPAANCNEGVSCDGVTFCNTSRPNRVEGLSQAADFALQPPLLRLVKGDYSLWASSERFQCLTDHPDAYASHIFGTNVDDPAFRNTDLEGRELLKNNDLTEGLNAGSYRPGDNGGARPTRFENTSRKSPMFNHVNNFFVRVEVCGELSEGGAHKCRAYGANKKPIGLLQEYGDVQFGLMTRSYESNKQFGALRKNITPFDDEMNADGTFVARPLSEQLYASPPDEDSIVASLNALRIIDYRYHSASFAGADNYRNSIFKGTYFVDRPDLGDNAPIPANTDCAWGDVQFENGICRNWGNPFSELMLESYRYFAGAPAPLVSADDSAVVPGLSVAEWNPPTRAILDRDDDATTELECLNMNVLAFNASSVSYDGDALEGQSTSGLGLSADGNETIEDLTNVVGGVEIDPEGKYFVGVSGDDEGNAGICTAKSISNLADVRGTCPDAPRLEGSYFVAGLAHYVYTNDMLPVEGTGENNITTYGVNLAGALPNIQVPVPGDLERFITILPACRNNSIGPPENRGGNCAIVDFRVLDYASPAENASSYSGQYFVSWEDSEQGGDYDQDLNGIIEYHITSTTLTVKTRVLGVSTGDTIEFGFVVAGTGSDNDTYYPGTTVSGNNAPAAPNEEIISLDMNGNSEAGVAGEMLEPPLYYAAKWGSFDKRIDDGNGIPDREAEWQDAEGLPRGYASVTNPSKLERQLKSVFENIIDRPNSGTAAAITAGTLTGEGMMLHTLYHPVYTGQNNANVQWAGRLNGLFIDAEGRLREDVAPLGVLISPNPDSETPPDPATIDPVVVFRYESASQNTVFDRYSLNADGSLNATPVAEGLALDALNPLWSARDRLAAISDTDIVLQRSPTNIGQQRRFIIAGVDQTNADGELDGIVYGDETIDFVEGSVGVAGNNLINLLDVADEAEGENIVNFIRGLDSPGYRNRTVNWGAGQKTWRLGDIVHSTPAIVGRPSAGYDTAYGDDSYSNFRRHYQNRRQMVYVGANDGMLHAFNGGFATTDAAAQTISYSEQSPDATPAAGDPPAPALGAEMWAYVPYNLLPHLKWLADPDYAHVYYVDSTVHTFDVNIFGDEDDSVYPGGWGTILVVGMRFGGGEYTVTGADGEDQTLRSAYVIMDITNPETPPKLLAEITHEDLGYTLGAVELVKHRAPDSFGSYDSPTPMNQWHLVFGSGPQGAQAVADGISDAPAKLFYLDLEDLTDNSAELVAVDVDDEGLNSFVGGITAKDWDVNYQDDMLYISAVGDDGRATPEPVAPEDEAPADDADADVAEPVAYKGAFKHAELNATGNLIDTNGVRHLLTGGGTNLPFSVAPLAVRDRDNTYWLFAGTGRFLVKQDLELTDENKFFGVKVNNPSFDPEGEADEPRWLTNDSVNIDNLRNVTADTLSLNSLGAMQIDAEGGPSDLSMPEYQEFLGSQNQGWYRQLSSFTGEANFTKAAFNEASLAFGSYEPSVNTCQQVGTSSLYILDMFTGLPAYNLREPFFSNPTGSSGEDDYQPLDPSPIENIGGMASDPTIINNIVHTINDRGELTSESVAPPPGIPVRRAWRELPMSD